MAKFLAFGADIMAKATVPIAMLSGFRKRVQLLPSTKAYLFEFNSMLGLRKQTDCVRCGKAAGTFKIGKITRYGAVCNVCSRYFREERECFECGQLSRTMLRASESGHSELLCLKCFQKYRFATCKNCRRYRKVHDRDNQLCRKCSEQRTSQCPKCKQDMPAGYGNICADCSRRTLLFNLIRMNVHLFRHKKVKRAYKKFIFWYLAKCGVSVVLKKSDDHVLFLCVAMKIGQHSRLP